MARAAFIYLLNDSNDVTQFAFTVKHEAKSCWERNTLGELGYKAYRVRDGIGFRKQVGRMEIDITDERRI